MFEGSINIEISIQAIVLSISMILPFATSIISGYRSINIQISTGQAKEEWVVSLESAFKNYERTARDPLAIGYPVSNEGLARDAKVKFVQYLADPYSEEHGPSSFSSRMHIHTLVSTLVMALCSASMAFGDWSMNYGENAYFQGLGCIFVVFWCYVSWEPMWKIGWLLKMGGIARQVRKECINGSVKGPEEDVEKSEISVGPKERLEWWIRESWKVCEDGHDISESRLSLNEPE